MDKNRTKLRKSKIYAEIIKIVEMGEIEKKINPRNLKGFRNPLKAETSTDTTT